MNAYTQLHPPQGQRINLMRRSRPDSPLTRDYREVLRFAFWGQWAVGTAFQLALLFLLALIEVGEVPSLYRIAGVVALAASIPIYALAGVYHLNCGYIAGMVRLFVSWCALIAVLAVFAVITKTTELFSSDIVLHWSFGGLVLQTAIYLQIHYLLTRWAEKVNQRRRTLIVGTGTLARSLAVVLNEPLVGMLEAGEEAADNQPTVAVEDGPFTFRNLGPVSQLHALIRAHNVNRVYIALPAEQTNQIEKHYVDLLDANVDVMWVPDVSELPLLNHSMSRIGSMPVVYLNESPLTSRPGSALLKATLDRVVAALGLIVLSPLMIATAIAVKLNSPGPVLFMQQRHGWNGSVFEMLKFRSMYLHEDHKVTQATQNDLRVTAVGRIIRKTSIDELPQLINVLKGDMSLVGPRPHAVAHNNYYSGKIKAYMARHRIKPGITGHAQINGYRGETDTLEKMAKRVELDLEYINNWSLWLDFKTLIKTPFILFSRNAY